MAQLVLPERIDEGVVHVLLAVLHPEPHLWRRSKWHVLTLDTDAVGLGLELAHGPADHLLLLPLFLLCGILVRF